MFTGSKNYHIHKVNTYFYIIVVDIQSLFIEYSYKKKQNLWMLLLYPICNI